MKPHVDKDGFAYHYYIAKTLVGGDPDCNIRFVQRFSDHSVIATFNKIMEPWTDADSVRLAAFVASLEAEARGK